MIGAVPCPFRRENKPFLNQVQENQSSQLLPSRKYKAMFLHCVHIAVKTPHATCITRRSNKANKIHIEPLPTSYFDVPMNISISVVEYRVPN